MEIRRITDPTLRFFELANEWRSRFGYIDYRSNREGNGSMKPDRVIIERQRAGILSRFCEEYSEELLGYENGWDVRLDNRR